MGGVKHCIECKQCITIAKLYIKYYKIISYYIKKIEYIIIDYVIRKYRLYSPKEKPYDEKNIPRDKPGDYSF